MNNSALLSDPSAAAAAAQFVAAPLDDKNNDEPIFRFLTARQFLQLDTIVARQVLPVSPVPRDVERDTALAYVFVSHRWMEPGNPDPDGSQLKTVQTFLRYVDELLQATLDKGSGTVPSELLWPGEICNLSEGMIQAAALVSRMKLDEVKNYQDDKTAKWLLDDDPLNHIYVWYDCACLPQKFPKGRTADEKEEFAVALQNLDALAQMCEVVCLHTSEDTSQYFDRAWCAFEHYQKSLDHFQGHLTLTCPDVLNGVKVDWGVTEEEDVPKEHPVEQSSSKEDDVDELSAAMEAMRVHNRQGGDLDAKHQMMQNLFDSRQKKGDDIQAETKRIMENSKRQDYKSNQMWWSHLHERIERRRVEFHTAQQANEQQDEAVKQHVIPHHLKVPDLAKGKVRMDNYVVQATNTPPLVDAMTYMVRELFTAVFHMSCRDAAKCKNKSDKKGDEFVIPPNFNQCVPSAGIQCGLHDHRQAQSLEDQSRALQEGIATAWKVFSMGQLKCPNGHCLQAGVASSLLKCGLESCGKNDIAQGRVYAACANCNFYLCSFCATDSLGIDNGSIDPSSQESLEKVTQACSFGVSRPKKTTEQALCERLVTVDLFELAHDMLTRFGLRCTNSGDVAFVGLLALRNILSLSNDRKDGDDKTKSGLRVSAGSLCFLKPVLEEAVALYANLLAAERQVTSLNATVSLKVPRWVLLDNAQGKLDMNSSLVLEGTFKLGHKVTTYLSEHPECISCSFDTNEAPVCHQFCADDTHCNGGWAPCQHEMQQSILATVSSATKAPCTLDPWATTMLPEKMASFATLCANGVLYVIGGANGDADPVSKVYTTCLDSVYSAKLPLTTSTTWAKEESILSARRQPASCVRVDADGNPLALLVGGGRASGVPGKKGKVLSSIEALDLDGRGRSWTKFVDMPRCRTSHHMVFSNDCMFVFGGFTHPDDYTTESQICDIYDFRTGEWKEGPTHPAVFCGGGLAVLYDRFVWVFGGVTGNKERDWAVQESWILDMKPWITWVKEGCPEKRPEMGWKKGVPLPSPIPSPNICVASHKETGLPDDWILSVAPTNTGNFCFGIKLPIVEGAMDKDMWLTERGFGFNSRVRGGMVTTRNVVLQWKKLGATPDAFSLGAAVVAKRTFAMLGGVGMIENTNEVCNKVHFRELPGKGAILPLAVADPGSVQEGAGIMAMLQGFGQNLAANSVIQLNDNFLIGRLGFPLEEKDLFTVTDGSKKIVVKSPNGLHCQGCLVQTQSIEAAKAHNDTALFCLKAPPTQMVPLCSECICDMYYNKPQVR